MFEEVRLSCDKHFRTCTYNVRVDFASRAAAKGHLFAKLTEVLLTLQLQTTASRKMVNGSQIIFVCLYCSMAFVLIEMSKSKIVRKYTLPNWMSCLNAIC